MSTTSLEDAKSIKFWLALIAEFIGTLLLVLVACGSCESDTTDDSKVVRISLAFGFSVATIVWMIAHISGGHINPAITFAFVVTRKISILRCVTLRRVYPRIVSGRVGSGQVQIFYLTWVAR